MSGKLTLVSENRLKELLEKEQRYEKALDEITRQYDYTTVNRAKEIANEALGREVVVKF